MGREVRMVPKDWKHPRVWIAKDKAGCNAIFAYAQHPATFPLGRGFYYDPSAVRSIIRDDTAHMIGLKIAPGQCVEFELRPVGTKRKTKQPAKAGRKDM